VEIACDRYHGAFLTAERIKTFLPLLKRVGLWNYPGPSKTTCIRAAAGDDVAQGIEQIAAE
jgi:hypothetical protein